MLNVPCWFLRIETYRGVLAADVLMSHVEAYFNYEAPGESPLGKPPVYLQLPGHSVVIVGFETWKKRQARETALGTVVELQHLGELVVFNCSVRASGAMRDLRDGKMAADAGVAAEMMKEYRISRYDLVKFAAFELVFLQDPKLFLAEY